MYLWKIDKLVDDFRQKKVSQKEQFKYLLLFTIFTLLCSDPFLYVGLPYNNYDTLQSILILAMSVFGVYYCYKINSQGDNKEFMIRFICLGLPAVIRILAMFLPFFVGAIIIEDLFLLSPEALVSGATETTLIQVATISLFVFVYYWYLSKKITIVSRCAAPNKPSV
ncbi:MAG: hypothetical protein DRG11_01915 [Epsilonproteobacteria bacterium]|nr:MAG: hypothetical protein DRG11_01915 [Campylobacterota bacterium]